MQSNNKYFDDLARLMTNAVGVAQDAKEELETGFNSWIERTLAKKNLVTRDEFEAVEIMARNAREENETLRARIDELEKLIEEKTAPTKKTTRKT